MRAMPASRSRGSSASRLSRRDLIRRLAGGVLVVSGLAVIKRVLAPPHLDSRGAVTLEALLDVVIPAGSSAGFRATQVLPRLVAELEADRRTRRGLLEGLRLLERRSRQRGAPDFASLPAERRAELFAACGRGRDGGLERYFYRIVRDGAVRLHYSRPEVWEPLGVPHPPQPAGYPDYAEAPDARG